MSSLLKRKHVLAASSSGAAKSYQDTIVSDGAVAYWPLDETSGTTAFDKVGTRHGTISGGVTLNQAGVNGSKCMVFDGSTGKISITSPVITPLNMSIEAWGNPASFVSSFMPFFSNRLGPSNGELFYSLANPKRLVVYEGGSGGSASGTTVLLPDTWHHCVALLNGTTVTFYLNGTSDGTVAFARASGGNTIASIGHEPLSASYFWGKLQDIAIYNRALTPAEIQSHYTKRLEGAPFSGLVSTDQLVSLWDFDADFNDKVGTNHLTNVNGVTRLPGKLGNAASFVQASAQRLTCASNASLQTGNISFTFVLWVKTAAFDQYLIVKQGEFQVGIFRGNQAALVTGGGMAGKPGVTIDNWHLIIAWRDVAGTDNIQLDNGTPVTVANPPGTIGPSVIEFGSLGGTAGYTGLIDQPLLFKRILSAAERTNLEFW